jgi:hypothetical protein
MTFSHINRHTATVLTAAVALGAAGPAAAQQIGAQGPVPVAPPQVTHHHSAYVQPASHRTNTAPGSDLVYVLIGGVVVAVGGLGGTLAAANRRRTAPARARIAA